MPKHRRMMLDRENMVGQVKEERSLSFRPKAVGIDEKVFCAICKPKNFSWPAGQSISIFSRWMLLLSEDLIRWKNLI